MSVPATCPFCNALVPATAPFGGGRFACPRCGETVATAGTATASMGPSDTPVNAPAAGPPRPTRRSMLIGIGLLLAAVVVGLVAANWHRFRSPFGNPTPPAQSVVVKPDDLPGLGYLPESTDAVLAIQMPFLLQRLGPNAGNDPVQALTALGLPPQAAELLDEATAVGLRNVDQLVVGLGFESHAMPPQITIVVHAARPFDLDGLARQEKARPLKRDGRTLYVGRAGPLPEIYWWKAADRVLVATILAKDMDAVPARPRAGMDHLRPALTGLFREAIAADASAWFAATSDQWDQYLRPYTLPFIPTPLQGRTDLIKPAERLRTITLSVPDDAESKVDVRIGLKSAEAGATLRGSLTDRFRGEAVEVSGEEEWARVQLPNDPARIGSIIGRLLAGGK
jgi:hypothetical protein